MSPSREIYKMVKSTPRSHRGTISVLEIGFFHVLALYISVPYTFSLSTAKTAGMNDASFKRNFKKCEINLNLNLK